MINAAPNYSLLRTERDVLNSAIFPRNSGNDRCLFTDDVVVKIDTRLLTNVNFHQGDSFIDGKSRYNFITVGRYNVLLNPSNCRIQPHCSFADFASSKGALSRKRNHSFPREASRLNNQNWYNRTAEDVCSRPPLPINRSTSLRTDSCPTELNQQVFRRSDLEIIGTIGQGFYGIARKIKHKKTGAIMVLKEMKSSDESCKSTFRKELQLLRRICHPNLLRFIGVMLQSKEQLCFIVEFIKGGTLRDIIHNLNINLSWHQRILYARDIAAGMDYLHSINVIHRDLNSSNCLVKENNQVVVADFGLSQVMDDEKCWGKKAGEQRCKFLDRKQRYNIVGSPYWMAPEMLKNQKYDEKVDIFSYGIVLCEIIGRVEADPDYLPRTSDFGLNVILFKQKLCSRDCPKLFVAIAIVCCEIEPSSRPPFSNLLSWLEMLALSVEAGSPLNSSIVQRNTQKALSKTK